MSQCSSPASPDEDVAQENDTGRELADPHTDTTSGTAQGGKTSCKRQVWRLGIEIPVLPTDTVISENVGRIAKIENLEKCTQLKSLNLTAQQVSRIEGLEATLQLEELELYQNAVRKIENIGHLVQLRVLDLSFNQIRVIENLENLTRLKRLYLSSNKITDIQGLDTLTELEELELGYNRIRVICNLDNLVKLKALWLGRNKITEANLPPLPYLERLSIQSNRLTKWSPTFFDHCPQLEELYLSHNALSEIPKSLASLKRLRILDLASNQISSLENVAECLNLEELWMNDNLIKGLENIEYLKPLKKLQTVYLERNPIQQDTGPGYRHAIVSVIHWLKQLDAILIDHVISVHVSHDDEPKSVMKHV